MKQLKIILFVISCMTMSIADAQQLNQKVSTDNQKVSTDNQKIVLVIHGGAGTILKANMTDAQEQGYREALTRSLQSGYAELQKGASAVDAVAQAILVLEDSPLFNAGKGAVFTHDGKNEMDASIMDGTSGMAGAVAGVTILKNPITAAIAVMRKSEHVMMVGAGAERFAKQQGLTIVDPSYFYTDFRWEGLQKIRKEDTTKTALDHGGKSSAIPAALRDAKFGTVGCVALDHKGQLAAGTSTGGMTNKKFGRVGDSPIIGAGTYANAQVGVSCTGWGEFYIRQVAAYDVAALMAYKGYTVAEASAEVIRKIGVAGGDGGMIALDNQGQVAMPFNTEGMYRGTVNAAGEIKIEIYK